MTKECEYDIYMYIYIYIYIYVYIILEKPDIIRSC